MIIARIIEVATALVVLAALFAILYYTIKDFLKNWDKFIDFWRNGNG
jgi:hypothetical protein